jgi:hypothetical protein
LVILFHIVEEWQTQSVPLLTVLNGPSSEE